MYSLISLDLSVKLFISLHDAEEPEGARKEGVRETGGSFFFLLVTRAMTGPIYIKSPFIWPRCPSGCVSAH